MTTQAELEHEMVEAGRAAAMASFKENEEKNRAATNPYAQAVYRRFVKPLSEILRAKYEEAPKKRGPKAWEYKLLGKYDTDVTAFISVKTALNILTGDGGDKEEIGRDYLARRIGNMLYGEHVLTRFENLNPALYATLARDLKNRLSKSERHRLNVFLHEAAKEGMEIPEWSVQDRVVAGEAMILYLQQLGMVASRDVSIKGKTQQLVDLDPAVAGLLEQIKSYVALTMPTVMPCIEPPKPWTSANDGGWHTQGMRRAMPSLIAGRPLVDDDDIPHGVMEAANILQDVAWQVNVPLMEAVKEVAARFDVGEVIATSEIPKPGRPEWLGQDMKKEEMDETQLAEFSAWKIRVAQWHTDAVKKRQHWRRYYRTLRSAQRFSEFDRIWFVWQFDYRQRMYAQSWGVNPQGSDLQKAMIRLAEGGPLDTPEALLWFKANGAARFGFDKVTPQAQAAWVDERSKMICRIADDPLSFREWTEADKPFMFLAWCQEYAEWSRNPDGFLTRLPVGLDGTCNGLQHYSAIMRDEVGGAATNLLPGEEKRDIYGDVAKVTEIIAPGYVQSPEQQQICDQWLKHGITRKATKRPVMTLPYGSTKYSCSDFILKDYLAPMAPAEFRKDEYVYAARWLSEPMWDAIGQVVVLGRAAMDWLQEAARRLVSAGYTEVDWVAPSGFVVRQQYPKREVLRINTKLMGGSVIDARRKREVEDTADSRRHAYGIAPNFIHACDSSHMVRCIHAARAAGIEQLAMIHDDYGTLPHQTVDLFRIIREEFVGMYQEADPLQALYEQHPDLLDPPPEKGDLDITQVLDSQFFFSTA